MNFGSCSSTFDFLSHSGGAGSCPPNNNNGVGLLQVGSDFSNGSMTIFKSSTSSSTSRKSLALLEALESQRKRIYGSLEDIHHQPRNQNKSNNNSNNNNNELFVNFHQQNGMPNATTPFNFNSAKHKLPDIQMINKYYGLVPKKFTVHSRNQGEKSRNARSKSALVTPTCNSNTLRFRKLTKNSSLEDPSTSPSDTEYNEVLQQGNNSNGDIQCVAIPDNNLSGLLTRKKISVMNNKKQLRSHHRHRSSSLPLESKSNKESQSQKKNELQQQQRIIKIDLNQMSWQEDGKLDGNCSNTIKDDDFKSSNTSLDSDNSDDETTTVGGGVSRSSSNSPEPAEEISLVIGDDYPTTIHPAQQPQRVIPWTQRRCMSLAERRGKLQRSVPIHSSTDLDDDDDYDGDECSTNESTIDDKTHEYSLSSPETLPSPSPPRSTPLPPSPVSVYKESRKSFYFKQAPEVSTMISQISPIETLEIQYEIEKFALLLANMQNQNKSFIDLSPHGAEIDMEKSIAVTGTRTSTRIQEKRTRNSSLDMVETKPNKLDINGNFVPVLSSQSQPDSNSTRNKGIVNNGIRCVMIVDSKNQSEDKDTSNKSLNVPPVSDSDSNGPKKTNPTTTMALTNILSTGNISEKNFSVTPSDDEKNGNNSSIEDNIIPFTRTSFEANSGNKVPSQVQTSAPVQETNLNSQRRRGLLKKSVSISCESELMGTSARNEVTNNANKSSRPKTAAFISPANKPKTLFRSSSTNSIVPQQEVKQDKEPIRTNRSPSSKTSTLNNSFTNKTNSNRFTPNTTTTGGAGKSNSNHKDDGGGTGSYQSQNQALKNRKILIKKALIDINQSSVAHFGKKCGILGRPKTAPISNTKASSPTTSTTSKPLKASPLPVFKSISFSQSKPTISSTMDKKLSPETNSGGESQDESPPKRILQRQSFSLDEGLLLGFSNKEFGWGSASTTTTISEEEDNIGANNGAVSGVRILKKAESLNSKKREECLKIYEKMAKTGMAVKLDTIFRGMMTPSEYRTFIKAAENAAREAAAAAAEEEDAGVNSSPATMSPTQVITSTT